MLIKNNKLLTYFLLILIVLSGLFFRLKGISDNHSFWQDEAFVADLGRDILTGNRTPLQAMKLLPYQPLYVLLVTVFLKIFGLNEFAARLPSVLFGTLGIIAAFLLAKRLSNIHGGILAAFVYAFLQLNLAHHTQAKPYAILQSVLLFNLFLLTYLHKEKNNIRIHILIIVLSITASLLHILGSLVWIPYFVFFLLNYDPKHNRLNLKQIMMFTFVISIFLSGFFLATGWDRVKDFFQPGNIGILYQYNNITYLRELLWKNYAFITLPAFFGILFSYQKERKLSLSIIGWAIVLLYLWTFRAFPNIRYLLPFFGVLTVYFSVFWAKIGKILFNKSWVACLIIIIFIFSGGYKFVRTPKSYYSPNEDLYGDVQTADYKTVYQQMKIKIPDLSERAVFTNWYDAHYWYLPEKRVDAYFITRTKIPYKHRIDGKMVYGTLTEFLTEKKKYKKGILIVEDWESLLPADIKQYAKKNLTAEFRVESLPYVTSDSWPIEVYSWTNTSE